MGNLIFKMTPFIDEYPIITNIKKKFAWYPKRCSISKKIIWLKNSYCVIHESYGLKPTWHDLKYHIFWLLKEKNEKFY